MPSLFAENKPARDYRIRAESVNTFVFTAVGEAYQQRVDTQAIRFGKATGYQLVLTLKRWRNLGSAVINWEAKLIGTGLWAFTQTETGTSALSSPWTSLIEIDALEIIVKGSTCNVLDINATAIRWYLAGALKYENNTDVALVDIIGYDARDNNIYAEASPNPGTVKFYGLYPACGASETSRQRRTYGTLTHGWRWALTGTTDWQYDEIDITNRAVPTPACPALCTCDCASSLPEVTIGDTTQQSWTIIFQAEYNDENVAQGEGTASCPCFEISSTGICAGHPPCTTGGNVALTLYSNRLLYQEYWSNGYFAPKSAPMEEHTYVERARVYCDAAAAPAYTTTTTVQDQEYTTCRTNSYILLENIIKYCGVVTAVGCETLCCEMDFDDCTGLIARYCIYEADRTVSWSVEPPCIKGVPAYDVGQAMGHWRGFVNDRRKLSLGWAANAGLTWTDTAQTPKVYWARVLQARTRKDAEIFVLYRDYTSGDMKLAKTTNFASALTAVVTVGAFSQGDIVWGRSGLLYVFYRDAGTIKAQVYDSQLSLVTSITTNLVGVDDVTIRAQEIVFALGAWRVAVQHTVAGVVKVAHAPESLTFTAAFTVATSSQADICWSRDGLLWAYYISAGTLMAIVYDLQLGTARSITTNLTTMDDAPFDVHDSVRSGGQMRIVLLHSMPYALLTKTSDYGETFAAA